MTVFVVPSSSFSSSSLKTYIQESMLGTTTSLGAKPLNRYCGPSSLAILNISREQETFWTPKEKNQQFSLDEVDRWKSVI